jgi:phosphatidylglycerophosphate synthase
LSEEPYKTEERRPLKTRGRPIARSIADRLIAARISPNSISLSSIGFAAFAMLCLMGTAQTEGAVSRILFVLSIVGVQARLLANLFDGMVAVDSGQASKTGELFNEIPDRIADVAILVGAGFAAGAAPALGYLAAIIAVIIAYIRALGASVGAGQTFSGPMAKPHRMATITGACAYCAIAPGNWPLALGADDFGMMGLALAVIVVGGVYTATRRTRLIVKNLRDAA